MAEVNHAKLCLEMMERMQHKNPQQLIYSPSKAPPFASMVHGSTSVRSRQEYEEFMVQSEILQIVFEGLRSGRNKFGVYFFWRRPLCGLIV